MSPHQRFEDELPDKPCRKNGRRRQPATYRTPAAPDFIIHRVIALRHVLRVSTSLIRLAAGHLKLMRSVHRRRNCNTVAVTSILLPVSAITRVVRCDRLRLRWRDSSRADVSPAQPPLPINGPAPQMRRPRKHSPAAVAGGLSRSRLQQVTGHTVTSRTISDDASRRRPADPRRNICCCEDSRNPFQRWLNRLREPDTCQRDRPGIMRVLILLHSGFHTGSRHWLKSSPCVITSASFRAGVTTISGRDSSPAVCYNGVNWLSSARSVIFTSG